MAETTQTPIEDEVPTTVYVREVAGAEVLAQISADEIRANGLNIDPGTTLYAVHTEDGMRMAVFSDRAHAFAAARHHGAHPVSVH